MDDLMNKLQNVLNDEESMKQIKELADMLASDMQENPAPQPEPAKPQQSGQMPDFSKLLQGLGMGNSKSNSDQPQNPAAKKSSDFDISKLMQLQGIMQAASKPDKNVDLLLALKPLLKEENQLKIDRIIKIFKIFAVYPALKESGLLGGDLFGLF